MKERFKNEAIVFIKHLTWAQADWAVCGLERIADFLKYRIKIKDANRVVDFKNDVFEMHPHWSGGCTCGYVKKIEEWDQNNPHGANCIIALYDKEDFKAIEKYGFGEKRNEILSKFTKPIRCSCGCDDKYEKWRKKHKVKHQSKCKLIMPNFIHKETGIAIKWQLSVGNCVFANVEKTTEWGKIVAECLESIK